MKQQPFLNRFWMLWNMFHVCVLMFGLMIEKHTIFSRNFDGLFERTNVTVPPEVFDGHGS